MDHLKLDEQHTLNNLAAAVEKADATLKFGCSDEAHRAVVSLSTESAGVIGLIYEKVADIYMRIDEVKTAINALQSSTDAIENMSWMAAIKRAVYHAPYAVALALVGFMFWCSSSGVSPADVLPWIKVTGS